METIEKKGISYESYKLLVEELVRKNKTSGTAQDENLVGFTKLNQHRMKRIGKQFKIEDEFLQKLQNSTTSMNWTILTEAWCGDAAQSLPIIAKIADLMPNTELKILFRNENLDLMGQFLTNGGRSIPKLIATDKITNEVLWTWGPRPTEVQEFVYKYKKKSPEVSYGDFNRELHLFYGKNKGVAIIEDFKQLIRE